MLNFRSSDYMRMRNFKAAHLIITERKTISSCHATNVPL